MHLLPFLIAFQSAFAAAPAIKPAGQCPAGKHWVRAHHRRAYRRFDGSLVAASNVSAHCAANPAGFSEWRTKIKQGSPEGWPHQEEKGSSWADDEIERTLEALSSIPEELWSSKVTGLYRKRSSRFFGNRASGFDGNIVIYDNAFDGKVSLERVLAHELAHVKFYELSPSDRDSYLWATNWYRTNRDRPADPPIYSVRKCCFVEDDGDTSPEEDFANNIEYFLFKPAVLKDKTVNAYNWIKNHFGDNFKPVRRTGAP